MNKTEDIAFSLDAEPGSYPFYYAHRVNLLPFISDKNLTLVAPLVAYVGPDA